MKNPFKAMKSYVTDNGNGMSDCCPPLDAVAKVFLVAASPIVGVAALLQTKEDK